MENRAIEKPQAETAPARLHWTPAQIETIKNTVARDASNDELMMFLHLSERYNPGPFAKEIWCVKMGQKSPPTIMTSRDGYLKIASSSPHYQGMQCDVVYSGDKFRKTQEGIEHDYGVGNRGTPVGAYALVHRDDRRYPTYFFAPFKDYKKDNGIWSAYPHAMILKVAGAMALKRAFSISGMVTQEEVDETELKAREQRNTSRPVEAPNLRPD